MEGIMMRGPKLICCAVRKPDGTIETKTEPTPCLLYTSLQYTPKAACEPLLKLVKSEAANAENNFNMDKNNLYVAECYVCPGPTLKRMMPRAQGQMCIRDRHYATEFPVTTAVAEKLRTALPGVEVLVSTANKDPYTYL